LAATSGATATSMRARVLARGWARLAALQIAQEHKAQRFFCHCARFGLAAALRDGFRNIGKQNHNVAATVARFELCAINVSPHAEEGFGQFCPNVNRRPRPKMQMPGKQGRA